MALPRDISLIFQGLGQIFRHESAVSEQAGHETLTALAALRQSLPGRLRQAAQKALSAGPRDGLAQAAQSDALTQELLQAAQELAQEIEDSIEQRLLAEAQRWSVFAITADRLCQHLKGSRVTALTTLSAAPQTDAQNETESPFFATLKAFQQHYQTRADGKDNPHSALNVGTIKALLDVFAVCRNVAALPAPPSLKTVEQTIESTLASTCETRRQHLEIFVRVVFGGLAQALSTTLNRVKEENPQTGV